MILVIDLAFFYGAQRRRWEPGDPDESSQHFYSVLKFRPSSSGMPACMIWTSAWNQDVSSPISCLSWRVKPKRAHPEPPVMRWEGRSLIKPPGSTKRLISLASCWRHVNAHSHILGLEGGVGRWEVDGGSEPGSELGSELGSDINYRSATRRHTASHPTRHVGEI